MADQQQIRILAPPSATLNLPLTTVVPLLIVRVALVVAALEVEQAHLADSF